MIKKLFFAMFVAAIAVATITAKPSKKEAQMKFDILSDVSEYDNFKEKSTEGNYNHVDGCDWTVKFI